MNFLSPTLPILGTIHPKVTAAGLAVVLTAIVAFVTNSFGLSLTPVEDIFITGAISAVAGYFAPPAAPPAVAPITFVPPSPAAVAAVAAAVAAAAPPVTPPVS